MSDMIMDGVWIINARQEAVEISSLWVVLGILLGAIAGAMIVLIIYALLKWEISEDVFSFLFVIIVSAGCFAGGVIADNNVECNARVETLYDVVVGDNVPFNEFIEQYEIIEQNGNIYTVKEKSK